MIRQQDTLWVILAGGQASRMGGVDKGLVTLNNRPLIDYVYSSLATQADNIVINANRHIEEYTQWGQVISDKLSGYPGPLAGFHTALSYSALEWVGFVPCDSPFLSHQLVQRFCAAADENSDALIAVCDNRQQPVFALLNKCILSSLNQFYAAGERKLMHFFSQCRCQYVDFSDTPQTFINLNTQQELNQMEARDE